MKVTVKLTGDKALIGSLGLLSVRGRIALGKTVDQSSAAILADAQARVPVGGVHDPHPGELKKTLRRKVSSSGLSATVMAGYGELPRKGKSTTRRRATGRGSSQKGIYAPPVEFGTANAPAHPFLFPALAAEKPAFLDACNAALDTALSDATRGTS